MRNDIQDQLIAASNVGCRAWKSQFSQWAAHVDFLSRTMDTAASAASTAVTDVVAKSALSALSSFASGTGTNYSTVYLRTKTTDVIFQAIDARRQNIVDGLTAKRFNNDGSLTDLSQYTLSQAIADALNYHDACSIESGLQQVSETLSPGAPGNAKSSNPAADASATTPPAGGAPGAVDKSRQTASQPANPPGRTPAPIHHQSGHVAPGAAGNQEAKPPVTPLRSSCVPTVTFRTASPALAGIAPRPCSGG